MHKIFTMRLIKCCSDKEFSSSQAQHCVGGIVIFMRNLLLCRADIRLEASIY